MYAAEEDHVELAVAGGDPPEALEPAKVTFYLVAPTVALGVVGPGPAAVGPGRDDWLLVQFDRQATHAITPIGAVHHHCLRPQTEPSARRRARPTGPSTA